MFKREKSEIYLMLACYFIVLILLCILSASCTPQRKLYYLSKNNPQYLYKFCKSLQKVDTTIIKGIPHFDTQLVKINCDTIIKNDTVSWIMTKKIPIRINGLDTVRVTTVDTSGMALLSFHNNKNLTDKIKAQGQLSIWKIWALIGYGIVILLAVVIGFLIRQK